MAATFPLYRDDDGTIRQFGNDADGSPWANPHIPQMPVPVGIECMTCDQTIGADDQGVTMVFGVDEKVAVRVASHRLCFAESLGLKEVLGGKPSDAASSPISMYELSDLIESIANTFRKRPLN